MRADMKIGITALLVVSVGVLLYFVFINKNLGKGKDSPLATPLAQGNKPAAFAHGAEANKPPLKLATPRPLSPAVVSAVPLAAAATPTPTPVATPTPRPSPAVTDEVVIPNFGSSVRTPATAKTPAELASPKIDLPKPEIAQPSLVSPLGSTPSAATRPSMLGAGEPSKSDALKIEPIRSEPNRAEPSKSEAVKVEFPKATAKPEPEKVEIVTPAVATPTMATPPAKAEPAKGAVDANSLVYEVKSGDSLWKIANDHSKDAKYQEMIEKANPSLDFSKPLRVGQKIKLPATGLTAAVAPVATPAPAAVAPAKAGEEPKTASALAPAEEQGKFIEGSNGQRTYIVKKGDSGFWKVAEAAYGDGTLWHLIDKANPQVGVTLQPGQRLIIPPKEGATGAAAGTATTRPGATGVSLKPAAPTGGDRYVVKSGDNGFEIIAKKVYQGDGSLWPAIEKANPSVESSKLRVGQELIIPSLADAQKAAGTTTRAAGSTAEVPEPAKPAASKPAATPKPASTPRPTPKPVTPSGGASNFD